MKAIPPSIFQFLGVLTNGDLGPYTFYTSHRKRLVVFLKTWPHDPATYHQHLNRNRWRHAAVRWQAIAESTKTAWNDLAKRGNCTVSGYNLFIHYILGKGTANIETLQRNTGIDVITPTGPPIPFLQ
ncbi:hypothetical protein ES703_97889 [subsurface metagenome]